MVIGGANAELVFSGLAPGLIGVYEIKVRIPAGAPNGRVPMQLYYGFSGPYQGQIQIE